MQLHAEGGDEQGRRRDGLAGRGRCRPQGQGQLDAGGHGRIVVTVVLVVGLERSDVGMDTLQRVDEVFVRQRCDGQEACFVRVRGVEAPVGDERMQMHEQAQVVAKPLHDDEDARVQRSATRQAMVALGEPPKRLYDARGEPLTHPAEQGTALAQVDGEWPGKREHPLPPWHRGQAMLDQQGGGLGHAPAHAREAAALAGKGNAEAVATALKYGLTLHPQKTRVVEFVRPDRRSRRVGPDAGKRPGTFDFLGFTHHWGRSRKGKPTVRRKTAKDRFRRSLKRVAEWCREHRHDDLRVQQKALAQKLRGQQKALAQKLRGHYGYFGIVGNYPATRRLLNEVQLVWCKWIQRRSQRARMNWDVLSVLLKRYALPQPRSISPVYRAANL